MIVAGIDPSLRMTGIAIVHTVAGEVLTTRVATQKPPVPSVAETRRRLRTAVERTLRVLPDRADLFVVEGPNMRTTYGQPHERAGLFWMLVDQLLVRGDVAVVPPKTRAKYACGSGNGNKGQVLEAMRARFPMVPVPDDNVADALALAAMGVRAMGAPIDRVGAKELEALAKVAWPRKEW